jgi:FixJ family two-component response regulator
MLLALDIHEPSAMAVESISPTSVAGTGANILIAARNGSHRRAFARFLRERGHAVKTTDNEEDALTLALTGDIDFVVTGHTMPGICGHELTRRLREVLPDLPVLLMSAGAEAISGIFLDVAAVLGSRASNSNERAEGILGLHSADTERLASLTSREKQVLNLVTAGHGNKAAARLLAISPRTVENHRARIMRKTSSRSLAELIHLSLLVHKDPTGDSKIVA